MPVRKRTNRRASRESFEITPAIQAAFDAYLASTPSDGGVWVEHWRLHDTLHDADALQLPFIPPCCYHPDISGVNWQCLPHAISIYNHLSRL